MNLGARGESLIKSFEELHLEAYHGAADPPGVWTIGWGHTRSAKPGMAIDLASAETLFAADTAEAIAAVNRGIRVPTTQSQFDAMVSLAFNIGAGAFGGSTVLRAHNAKRFFTACVGFVLWLRSGGRKRRGLLRRRCLEAALFCEDFWGEVADD